MLVTTQWIKENYIKFNNLYFDGKLSNDIEFKVSRSSKTWGYASYRWFKSGIVKPIGITISNYYDSPEEVKMTTLLHEMIHIYDYTINPHHFIRNGRKVRYDAHGFWFKNEAKRLQKFGWEIEKYVTAEEKAVSSLSKHSQELLNNKIEEALICAVYCKNSVWYFKTSTFRANEAFNTIYSSNYRYAFNNVYGGIKTVKFYSFDNPTLAKRRSCATKLSGWNVTYKVFDEKLRQLKATEVFIKTIIKGGN